MKALLLQDGLREFVEVCLPVMYQSAQTRDDYGRDIQLLVAFLEGRGVVTWQEVGLKELQLFLQDQEHLATSSRHRRVYAIKAFFRYLVAYGYIVASDDPAAALIPPPVTLAERRFLLKNEIETLLAQVDDPRDRAIITVFLQTGLKLDEMVPLTVNDVQLPRTISPESDQIGFLTLMPKRRKATLNWKACLALQQWLQARRRLVRRKQWLTSALWVSRLGDRLSARGIHNVVKKYMDLAGIEDASPYSLRHTYAMFLLANGGPVKLVQEILGHQRRSTTNKYKPLVAQYKRALVQRVVL